VADAIAARELDPIDVAAGAAVILGVVLQTALFQLLSPPSWTAVAFYGVLHTPRRSPMTRTPPRLGP
jgi:hypothetical protein